MPACRQFTWNIKPYIFWTKKPKKTFKHVSYNFYGTFGFLDGSTVDSTSAGISILTPRLGTQPPTLHHCAWNLVTRVLLWGPLGGPLFRWPCYHRWIARGMCQEALDLERSNGGERTESNCRKDEDHDLWYGPGPLAEFRWVSMCCLSHRSGQQQIFCNGCKYWVHKKCSGLKRLAIDPDYRCTRYQGTACPLDGRPQRGVQVGPDKLVVIASFCYLGDMLSAVGGCELSTTTRENCLEEVQGAATSSVFPLPLFQDTWQRVQLLCVECNAPC